MEERDLLLARQLQEQFDEESAVVYIEDDKPISHTGSSKVPASNTQSGLSVIDPVWETTDPNPDVHALFLQYDEQYFWGRLKGVEVKWSPRMTLCAGVCSYEGRGGLCSIRLSVPLLKLRPRKDLVETLLHEMIHAFLFVTENDRDRDGHGPNFKKHMHRINKASGSKITIYHDFHDEVDNYRQHWWRCDGPCRNSRPYYGWVKRSMNRAPSAQDFWWAEHQKKCGGTYTKVKEPEGYGQKKKGGGKDDKQSKTEKKNTSSDIRTFFGNGQVLGSSGQNKGATGSGAEASKKKTTSTISNGILTKTPTGSNSGSDMNKGNASGAGKSKGSNPNAAKGKGRESGAASNKGNNPGASTSKTDNSNMPQLPSLSGDNDLDAAFDLPFDLDDWDGGIWSSQEDSLPGLKNVKETSTKNATNTQSKIEVATQKTWAVLEADADQQKKDAVGKGKTWTVASTDKAVNEKGAEKSGGGMAGGGNILGSKSDDGLSWLARMRKQWAKDEKKQV